jgi:hypothetical protein
MIVLVMVAFWAGAVWAVREDWLDAGTAALLVVSLTVGIASVAGIFALMHAAGL